MNSRLIEFSEGDSVEVTGFDFGVETVSLLESRGLRRGKKVTVVAKQPFGPFILHVSGTKLAVGRKMVSGIRVGEV